MNVIVLSWLVPVDTEVSCAAPAVVWPCSWSQLSMNQAATVSSCSSTLNAAAPTAECLVKLNAAATVSGCEVYLKAQLREETACSAYLQARVYAKRFASGGGAGVLGGEGGEVEGALVGRC